MHELARSGSEIPQIENRTFAGRVPETEEAYAKLSAESQAALRQYSLERTMGYGIDYADAVELRSRVLAGQSWQDAATALAGVCEKFVQHAPKLAGTATRIAYLRRASALLRISQAMMLSDSDERRAIFKRSIELYAQASELAGDCISILIETSGGSLAGWYHPADGGAVGSVMVIGGVEGWGMDFSSLAVALAARGIDAYMLDGPGQGETRFVHNHYLSQNWKAAYCAATDYLSQRRPGLPIGFIGNSMGGTLAMAYSVTDKRIVACCNNGGPIAPSMVPQDGTFFAKMMSFAGTADRQTTLDIWRTIDPAETGPNTDYSLLLIHGKQDPLVSNDLADMLYQKAPTSDKHMVTFSDGDHCIYRHKQDRDALIADWMRTRIAGERWIRHKE